MPSFDTAFGIHQHAVALRSQRAEILAANLANADTPGYRARDVDFRQALAAAAPGQQQNPAAGSGLRVRTTHGGHLGPRGESAAVRYRQPLQPSLDQNTVDAQAERAAFLDNAMRYQASLRFLNGRVSGLMTALRGE